jgi:lipopolysaccharide export system permease protein
VFRLIHRSIFYDLVKVFSLAFIGLTALLLMAGLIAEASRNGLGPLQILAAVPLLVPSTMPYTLPTTTLFAVCVVYGRLAHDNEILALRAAGVHIRHAVWPAFLLGSITSITTIGLHLNLIPYTHYLLRTEVAGDVRELLYGMLRRERMINHPRMEYEIHVTRMNGERLIGAQFRRRDSKGQFYDFVAYADEAELLIDTRKSLIYVLMKNCNVIDKGANTPAALGDRVWPVQLPDELTPQGKIRPSDMTWMELFDYRREMEQKRDAADAEIALHQAQLNLQAAPKNFEQHIRDKLEERRRFALFVANIDAELWQRPAFALGCLCFVMVGCPVGMWFSKSDFLSAFVTCFLPIVVVYYPLMLCGINLVKSGKIVPFVGICAADVILLVAAALMYRRLARS